MHDSHIENAVCLTLGEVSGQEVADLGWTEGVEVQLIGDGQGDGLQIVSHR